MSTSRPRSRAVQLRAESLETRQLLSTVLTGRDTDGDRWVLRLLGPGDLRVTKQPDATGTAQTLDSASEIDQITVAGGNPLTTRLVGQVKRGADADGRVFFNGIDELGGRAEGASGSNGVYAIDIPDFWLGKTSTDAASVANAPSIQIPDGVITLRFGGADTTFTPGGATPLNTNNQNDTFNINLGIPRTQGTSVIVKRIVTDAQAGATSSTGQPGQPTQDSVVINVEGRINQFQADSIEGNTQFPSTGFAGGGGTLVVSSLDQESQTTGQIGFARVGGNATNFSVQTNDKISNFYVGGEANNVLVLAPNGSRAIAFGKGMDTVTILSHYIDTIQTNRGALNSSVTVDRNVGRLTFGGDVINTVFQSGVQQNLADVFQNQSPPINARAQDGGAIRNVLIAGNVINSTFSASAEPLDGTFGIDDLLLPHGNITAKVGGFIDNSSITPDTPNQAFFSKFVKVDRGPVIPPSVPELPFGGQGGPPNGRRVVKNLQPTEGRRVNYFPKVRATRAAALASLHLAKQKGSASDKA